MSILWALEIPGIQIYLFRRLYDDLVKNHLEGPTGFRQLLAPWINTRHPKSKLIGGRLADVVDGEIRFWNGSRIFLCHCQHEKDLIKYQGPEFHVLFLEEATQFTERMIRFLRSRMRIPDTLKIPDKYKGLFPRAVYTANPGGVGHRYIKDAFIKGRKELELFHAPKDDGGHLRQFIPARVDDNPSVDRDAVKANLAGLPPALVDAMLNGNWNAVVGAYFPELDRKRHIIQPFQVPDYWVRFMSMDWGACGEGDPFSIGWWAVSDGSVPLYPRGALVLYRSYYGRGLPKITVSRVAEEILRRERSGESVTYRVAGGDILEQRGTGPSIMELFAGYGIHFQRADMRRNSGWQQCRERLDGQSGVPMIYFFEEYVEEVETMMNLQHDPQDPNDCAPGDDHFADMVRYGAMSRPWSRESTVSQDPWRQYQKPSINDLWELREQQLQSERDGGR